VISRIFTGSLVAALLAGTAGADTLRNALVSAYQTNPTLTGQRESLKATDANVAIAKAAGRPRVTTSVGLNRDLSRTGLYETGAHGPRISVGVDLSYPIYSGGSVKNSVRAAKTRVEAGRATLRAVEGDIFTQAVSAYMDVIRDRAIVELNQNNVKVLETNLEATRDRFQIGDLTRTDVAQSEARLQLGRSRLALAQGRLTASEATYREVIGHPPGDLAPPPPLPPLPATADEAVRIALANNPDLVSISRQAVAAGYDVRVAEAGRLPTLSAVGSGTYANELGGQIGNLPTKGSQTSVGLNLGLPIFQGGLPAAQTRRAQALEGQTIEQVVGTERAVVSTTRSAFASWEAAQKAIQSNTVAVQANELALEGARAEQSVGTRTVLDVLNAEQELLNSQVELVTAKRDDYVSGFELLNAMGQAEAQNLGLDGGPLYDPLGNYRRVADNWSDWASDPRHAAVATRTVDPQEMPAAPVILPSLLNSNRTPPPASETGIDPAQAESPVPSPAGVTQPPQ
jgi:outer membrane protein